MQGLLIEYLPIVIFLALAGGLGLLFMGAAWVLAPSSPDNSPVAGAITGIFTFSP